MGMGSLAHWAIVAVAIIGLLGISRIPKALGELGKGLRVFNREMREMVAEGEDAKAKIIEAAALNKDEKQAPLS